MGISIFFTLDNKVEENNCLVLWATTWLLWACTKTYLKTRVGWQKHKETVSFARDQEVKHEKPSDLNLKPCLYPSLCPQNIVLELSEHPSFCPALFSLNQRRHLNRKAGCTHLMDVPYYWPGKKEMTTTSSCQWHIAGTWSKVISQGRGCSLVWWEKS